MIMNDIWDFDGTLFDTYPLMMEAFLLALKKYKNINSDYDTVYRLLKHSSDH